MSGSYAYEKGPATFALQRIDVAARRRLSERRYTFDNGLVRPARHDALSSSMLVGVSTSPYYYADPSDGYQLLLLPYE